MTDRPVRIQLRRTKGWRLPDDTEVVSRPTRWGNPFKVGDRLRGTDDAPWIVIFNREQAVAIYRSFMDHQIGSTFRAAVVAELRGKNFACWCPLDQPCHADVLLEIANA